MSRSRFAPILVSLAWIGVASLAACQSIPPAHELDGGQEVAAPTSEPGVELVERLLEVRIAGQTVGWVEASLSKHPDGTWVSHDTMSLSMIREGGGPEARFYSTTESQTTYGPDRAFVSELETEEEAGVTITRFTELDGGELVSSYTGPGLPEINDRFELPPDYRSSLAVEFELVEEYERTGEPASITYASFSSHRMRFERTELTLVGATTYEYGGESIPAWIFHARHEDGTKVATIVDHDFMALSYDAGGTFVASLVDAKPDPGATGGGRINSELPVRGLTTANWAELAEQKVTVTVEGDSDASAPSLWEDSHYHQVERDGERYAMTLRSTRPDASFRAPKLPLTIEDPEIRRFLAATPMSQSDNPRIVTEAAAIVDGEKNSMVAAQKIVNAVFTSIDKRAGVRGSATASEVLANGAGDCTEHAVLVVALMRASGIPARVVDGIVFASDRGGQGMAGYHAWAEIWLGQWIGVDATVGETGTSARYLNFGVDEPGMPGSNGKMLRAIGKTTIELGPHLTYDERG